MSSWSGCECTFLSSETHIQLYTSLLSLHVFLNQTFSLLVFFDLHRVPAIQVQVFFPSQRLCVPERKRTHFPSSTLLAVFFFSTLICSSSCWTWLCPSPPSSLILSKCSTHPLTQPPTPATPLFQHTPYHPPPSLPLFYSPSSCCTLGVCCSPGGSARRAQQCDRLRSGACCRQPGLKSTC